MIFSHLRLQKRFSVLFFFLDSPEVASCWELQLRNNRFEEIQGLFSLLSPFCFIFFSLWRKTVEKYKQGKSKSFENGNYKCIDVK